jgi:protein-tyrosine phosphatase
LCVCTSNLCRSPAAELLLRAGLRQRLGEQAARAVEISSAGIWASDGRPVEPGTAKALRAHGVSAADLAAARSTPLRREAVAAAELVIASAAEHVRGVWRLQIAARYRTFTLGELTSLTETLDPATLPPIARPGPATPLGPAVRSGATALLAPARFDRLDPAHADPTDPADPAGAGPAGGLADRLRALVRAASAVREARRLPDAPFVTDAYDLADPTDSDVAQRDMVEQTVSHVDVLLDLLAGPAPHRRPARDRDRVHWPAWAVEWSRNRARRGASR